MPELLPELWESILRLISNPHKQRMYGVNRLFMTIVFADKYRHVKLSGPGDAHSFVPCRQLHKTVIHVRYVRITPTNNHTGSAEILVESQSHITPYIRSLDVFCTLFDAADIGNYHDKALGYHYGATSAQNAPTLAALSCRHMPSFGHLRTVFATQACFRP
jgi:hypothetical protein